nr:DUF692 family multinuclear iron-containing protein [Flavihumibacter fluvii]
MWFEDLLAAYSAQNRLIGHGVFFSLFSGRWSDAQQNWLAALRQTSQRYRFDHITEHFGFITGKDFHQGAPMSIPYTPATLAIGQDRLKRIQDACSCPVGLENLAFSYSLDEVKEHGEFLQRLIEPVNGFIILDLHNLYCQINNFDIGFEEIISLYPLDKVREIHISGGSWDEVSEPFPKNVRRDTHDSAVPEPVFDLLKMTIEKCPALKYVVLEQLGSALSTPESQAVFQQDFLILEEIVQEKNKGRWDFFNDAFLPSPLVIPDDIIEDEALYQQQKQLAEILEHCTTAAEAQQQMRQTTLANSAWDIEHWQPYMLETAIRIAQKWKDGFE